MAELYNADGELVEGALTPDEIQAIKDEKDALASEAAAIKERLSKLEAKDMNFRKLEQMTEEEKAKLSDKEKELMLRQEALETQQKEFTSKQIESSKNHVLTMLVGDDEETRAKVLKNYDRIKDEATSLEEISIKMNEAYSMTIGTQNIANPLSVAMGFNGGQAPKKESTRFADTERGKAIAKELGLPSGN